MNTIIEKIRAEIERLEKEHQEPTIRGDEYEEGGINGYHIALDKVLAKLDTLQEQPVDLDNKTIMEEIRKLGCYPSEFDVARRFYSLGRQSKEQPVSEGLDYKNWDDLLTEEMAKVYGTYTRPSYIEENSTQASCHFDNFVARHFYELGRQSKEFYAEELDEEIIRYKVPFVNEKENLDERTLNAIAYHFATWMESKFLHECESAYNNGYVAGQQSKPEVSEDVDEAAKAYADDINSNECLYTYTDFTDAFKAGAKWQKEQMMKEAVEGEVTETCGIASVWIKTKQFKPGQKVRIIIVKED